MRIVGELLSGGEMVPAQLPSPSNWSPERKLAGAVLASALVEIRDRHSDPSYRRRVNQAIEWILSDDVDWPFSFIPLCQLFDLEPEYVRNVVKGWLQVAAAGPPRQSSAHRHAA